jgi:hypothetical protein
MFHQCGDKFQDNLDSSSFSFADPSYLFS